MFQSLVSLAWPAALVACMWMFRERLNALLPLLRMKYKDFDVSFRLEQAEKEVAQIAKPPGSPDFEPTPEEKSRFEKVAEHSPRAAILEKRVELEQVLRPIAEPYLSGTLSRNFRNLSLTELTRVLRQQGVIDEKASALLDDLRTIGNQAAHSPRGSVHSRRRFKVWTVNRRGYQFSPSS